LFTSYSFAQYSGTASVTQGLATSTTSNLYTCSGGRISAVGTITASNSTTWTVPAVTNFTNASFPFASDLNNVCDGNNYATATDALAALNGSDIVTIDATGEIITAYVFLITILKCILMVSQLEKTKFLIHNSIRVLFVLSKSPLYNCHVACRLGGTFRLGRRNKW